ncbi:hypothetical protein BT63DRAFT_425994 [Microthyrium microscopicum]|uniref:Zn(2)-C6 fungal-type domain-containing protein n=1 Tax=Microthyrium microscopicum TaxID=703497 RepID=A0A6A6UC83_9PEZI|nr:hypothetical protein BT63DRAFT_425994 [Microthyrium microscopicum]
MPYYGKISLACSLCRTRKIKCDQLRPSCSQCLRISATCTGYRDPKSTVFRHYSYITEKRKPLPESFESADSDIEMALKSVTKSHRLDGSLSISTNDLVTSLFYGYFTVGGSPTGHLFTSWLPKNIPNTDNDASLAAFRATGYALLFAITKSQDQLAMARQKYSKALYLTRQALESPDTSQTCWIVRIILLLSLFETFACTSYASLLMVHQHFAGAAALLRTQDLYNKENPLSKDELQVFLLLRRRLVATSLMRKMPIATAVIRWSEAVKKIMTPDELWSSELWDGIAQLANLQAKLATNQPANYANYIQPLEQQDRHLSTWANRLPQSWRYEIRSRQFKDEDYPTYYYKYIDYNVALDWTHYRVARCIIHHTILKFSQTADVTIPSSILSNQIVNSERIIQSLCDDICATVPYFLRQTDQSSSSKPGIDALDLVWPLHMTVNMDCAPLSQRLWAQGKLQEIGETMGISLASQLAAVLKPAWLQVNANR